MADRPGRMHPPPIYVLGDDDDDDEVVAVVDRSGSRGGAAEDQRRRRGREAASGHSVVDLTSDNKRRSSSSARNNRTNGGDDEEEVEFVGSSSSRAPHHQYRSEPSSSYVRFVGTKRSRPAPVAAVADGRLGQYRSFGNDPDGGYAAPAAGAAAAPGLFNPHFGGFNPLDYVGMLGVGGGVGGRNGRLSSPASGVKKAKKSRKKRSKSPPPPSPMEKGKAIMVPTGFDALDMYYPHLNAADRTSIMHRLLPEGYSKKWTHEWRVAYDKAHPKAALWGMAAALSDEITGINKKKKTGEDEGDKKLPVKKNKGKGGKENQKPSLAKTGKPIFFPTKKSNNDDNDDDEDQKLESVLPTPSIGPLSGKVIDDLRTYFCAHVNRVHHKAFLNGIEPVDVDKDGHDDGLGVAALTCSICADPYDATYMVPCSGEDELHFFCKSCFVSYATVTVQSGPVQSLVCPMPDCDSLFATADANANLSEWDKLMIEHRETSRDRRVALAAKAVLHCECGALAIITKNDVGNGRIVCPGASCGKRYCCKCGNDDHGTDPCPPPAETVQWLDKHSKECPNCKNRIEKNGGCDHMTCRPSAGGCGHDFWWTCGCPYAQHQPGCKRFLGR